MWDIVDNTIQKIAEAAADLIGDKITDKIIKVSRSSQQNSSETVESKIANTRFDREILKKRYKSSEERLKNIHDLTLM